MTPRDGDVGAFGYEINVSRDFHRHTSHRSREVEDARDIHRDIIRLLVEATVTPPHCVFDGHRRQATCKRDLSAKGTKSDATRPQHRK